MPFTLVIKAFIMGVSSPLRIPCGVDGVSFDMRRSCGMTGRSCRSNRGAIGRLSCGRVGRKRLLPRNGHGYVAALPLPNGFDRLSGPLIFPVLSFEQGKDMLGAIGGPQCKLLMPVHRSNL
ncbi:hypothetical protein QE389_001945 [Brevundimonas sp. SORGH_AS 993]|nr:hypothetical protein [Brevundimonas sp. SORGH_AS_0993]MDQ1154746.1 hypothetical protein [Brevundimonas sp. SORGH_AS_0993]